MNIIYLLTNLDKKEGEKRFYIGSKSECRIEIINNLRTIIDIKTEKPYLGSATCYQMKCDIINGHKFSASILETVNNRSKLLEIENNNIKKFNAVSSSEYYNQSYALLGGFTYDHNAIINFFGEKRKDYNSSKSGISKRNKTAKKFGFNNLGDFSVSIYREYLKTRNFVAIAKTLNCERHTPARFIESYDMEKCLKEIDILYDDLRVKIRDLYVQGASIHKISNLTGLEIPTITIYMDKFEESGQREYLTAKRKNLTEEELKLKITKLVLEGASIREASKILGINSYSANRYFLKCIRERLQTNDL